MNNTRAVSLFWDFACAFERISPASMRGSRHRPNQVGQWPYLLDWNQIFRIYCFTLSIVFRNRLILEDKAVCIAWTENKID